MKQLLLVLKQRRLWASFFALVAIFLPDLNLNVDLTTQAVLDFLEAISGVLAVILPIWSLANPKRK